MHLSEEDQISYLANAIFVAQADGAASPKAAAALEQIRASIGAKKSTYDLARKRALSGRIRSPRLEISLLRLATWQTCYMYVP